MGFDPVKYAGVLVLTNSATGADDIGFYLIDQKHQMQTTSQSTRWT